MEDLDKSAIVSSTAGCSGSGGGLVYSPGSCLSSGYCSDDAASANDDVFFGRHGKDCWMSSTGIDTVDILRGSLPPPFDADLSSTASGMICHDSVVDTAVRFDDVVDNWLFNSMSVPSPCVDHDWPLPAPALSTPISELPDDLPTDSVLADLLLNQSAYTAASKHPTRPEAKIDNTVPSAVTEPGRKPETASAAEICQTESSLLSSVISATKRTLDVESWEPSAARRRRSSPCRGGCRTPEVTSSSASGSTTKTHRAAVCCDCSSTESVRHRSESFCASTSTEVDLSRLSALRPEWPGFADLVVSEPACPPERSSDSARDDTNETESSTKNSDVEEQVLETSGSASAESKRTETSRPVILEALLRSSNKLDANKGSSVALVLIRGLSVVRPFSTSPAVRQLISDTRVATDKQASTDARTTGARFRNKLNNLQLSRSQSAWGLTKFRMCFYFFKKLCDSLCGETRQARLFTPPPKGVHLICIFYFKCFAVS